MKNFPFFIAAFVSLMLFTRMSKAEKLIGSSEGLSVKSNAHDSSASHTPRKKYVIAYVGGFRGLGIPQNIDAAKLTGINYAFVDVKNNRAWLHNERTDTTNFRKLNLLKSVNPNLTILISIGGWTWSGRFSDAVYSDSSRAGFASSATAIVSKYNLDGIDIDWEYPAMRGDSGNVYRPEDSHNYTLMFIALRHSLDSLSAITHKKYLLSTAVGNSTSYIEHTEMGKVAEVCDYINLMCYDYGDSLSAHHTNLYASKGPNTRSSDRSVREFIAAGVPASKLNLGVAMYGKGIQVADSKEHGLHQKKIKNRVKAGGYTFLRDSLIGKGEYKAYWDHDAKAPYLFNKKTMTFITYDNERSIKEKCRYIDKNALAGIMFWEYSNDEKAYLLNEISKRLKD